MQLFAKPAPGMFYDGTEGDEGQPVTILGVNWGVEDDTLMVSADGDLFTAPSSRVTFVGLVPTHESMSGGLPEGAQR